MMILGDKKTKSLKILRRIIVKPHRIELRIVDYRVSSYLMYLDNDSIMISEFEPKMYNNLLEHFSEFTMYLSELDGFKQYDYTFKTELLEETTYKDTKAYRLTVPELVRTKSSDYVIKPLLADNVAVRFKLKDLPQFRRVEEINESQMIITGNYDLFRTEYGKEIHGLELKLPFERITFAAKFKHLKGEKYAFEGYMEDNEMRSLMFKYADTDFSEKNNLSHYDFHKKAEETQIEEIEGRERKVVLLVDDKPVVTDIMKEMLEAKTNYDVVVTNDSTKTIEMVIEYEPDVILLDQIMPGMSGLEVATLLKEKRITSRIPILFMTAFNDSKVVKQATDLGIVGYLLKPVDSKKLIEKLQDVMGKTTKKSINLVNSVVYICSDDEKYSAGLQSVFRSRKIECRHFRSLEDMIRFKEEKEVSVIVIRMTTHSGMSLSIVNTTRRRKQLHDTYIIVYPQKESELKLLKALKDPRLVTLNTAVDAEMLGGNLEKYLGVLS